MKTTLIACCDSMGGIGKDGGIPWYLPSDLKHFSEYTKGKPCVMGRKTWDSLPVKPLPNRENWVLASKNTPNLFNQGVNLMALSASSIMGVAVDENIDELCIIGGASVYEQFLPFATNIVLTNLSKHYHCDTFFPKVDFTKWKYTAVKQLEPDVNVNYWERRINE